MSVESNLIDGRGSVEDRWRAGNNVKPSLFIHQELAEALIPDKPIGTDFIQGVVTAVDWTTRKISVQLEGSATTLTGIAFLQTFMPIVGNSVWLMKQDSMLLAIGSPQMSTPVAYTVTMANWGVGNGSLSGQYMRIGNKCEFDLNFVAGSTSTFAGEPSWTLPFQPGSGTTESTIRDTMQASLTDNSAAGYIFAVPYGVGFGNPGTIRVLYSSATGLNSSIVGGVLSSTLPITWTTSDAVRIGGYFYTT